MDTNRLAKSLNDLLEYLNDSHMGYQQSSAATADTKMSSLFRSLSMKRQNMAKELAEQVKSFGDLPEKGGSVAGAVHRLFVNLKGAITDGNVDSIVNEIKRGENTMVNRYKEVLREQLPPDIRSLLTTHLTEIEENLASVDELSVLK